MGCQIGRFYLNVIATTHSFVHPFSMGHWDASMCSKDAIVRLVLGERRGTFGG